MAIIRQVTPFMYAPSVPEAVRFFRDLLGFRVESEMDGYAYVSRDGAAVRILQADDHDHDEHGNDVPRPAGWMAPPPARRFRYYFDCDDVDALAAELRPRLAHLPAGDVYGPVDQPYGQREYMILAPDGDLVVFGAPIAG
ncbi:MAG: VOC family protein [Dehalococcoidia bacterium]